MTLDRQLKGLDERPRCPAFVTRARGRSATRARQGLIDVAIATTDSPIGELTVAVTRRGLAAVSFEGEGREAPRRRPTCRCKLQPSTSLW